ncbi:MAG: dihydrofolate reductase family protein [Luteimonas sp.]
MGKVILNVTMSLDGFVAGADVGIDQPMGEGGMRLHEWLLEVPQNDVDTAVANEIHASASAVVLGKRTFEVGLGLWGDTPFPAPCFVLTHEKRDPLPQTSGAFFFVNDGVESAVKQARVAAKGGDVALMGADIAQQCLRAGLVDEINLQVAPVLLGNGRRLFEQLGDSDIALRQLRVVQSPRVAHIRYRVENTATVNAVD